MRITFFTNSMNLHQEGICDEFYQQLGKDFKTVVFEGLPDFRIEAGFKDLNYDKEYVSRTFEYEDEISFIKETVDNTDVGIVGAAPSYIINLFLAQNKKVFLYSERFFKKGQWRRFIPSVKKAVQLRYSNDTNFEVLCASSYLKDDLRLCGYKGKCLRWGYFPNLDKLCKEKKSFDNSKLIILWTSRFVDWKHPEIPIKLAHLLKKSNVDFQMNLIGGGDSDLKRSISHKIDKFNLNDCVKICAPRPPEEVHALMAESDIFLATSDFNEGWGVIINEALAAGCITIASNAMGASDFLIEDGYNGFKYNYNDINALYSIVMNVINDKQLLQTVSLNAKKSYINSFSPKVSVERLLCYLNGKRYDNGICSVIE